MNGYHFGGELTVTSGKNEADFTPEELKEFKTLSELGQSIYSFTSHLNMTTWAVSPPFYYHYLNSYKRPPRVVIDGNKLNAIKYAKTLRQNLILFVSFH